MILDKFKVLNTDPDERQNTPETKASKDKEDGDESNKDKVVMFVKSELHDTEEAELGSVR